MFAVSVPQSVSLSVRLSVCLSVCFSVTRLDCVWCIRAAFAKVLWPLVITLHLQNCRPNYHRLTCIDTYSTRVDVCFNVSFSALEVFFKNDMRYINSRFTYLLTYLLSKNVIWLNLITLHYKSARRPSWFNLRTRLSLTLDFVVQLVLGSFFQKSKYRCGHVNEHCAINCISSE